MLILVDPPVKECLHETRKSVQKRPFKNDPYQYGYIDFSLWLDEVQTTAARDHGPPRECAYTDVGYYLSQLIGGDQALTPYAAALVVKKLTLSHTTALIEYMKALISTLEDRIRKSRGGIESYAWLQETLTELFGWNRRLSEYCEHTEAALDELHILRDGESDS